MNKEETILADKNGFTIKIVHYRDDPANWIVQRWKKGLFGSRREYSAWFIDRQQAEKHARRLADELHTPKREFI